jgi:hypothetical protein
MGEFADFEPEPPSFAGHFEQVANKPNRQQHWDKVD